MRRLLAVAGGVVVLIAAAAVYVLSTSPPWFERIRYPLHYASVVRARAHAERIDPALLAAVIYQESKFRPDARSASGAIGLMQVLPATAEAIALRTGGTTFTVSDLTDPAINIRYGTWYLHDLVAKYGSLRLALAAYNAGQGNVDKWQAEGKGIQFPETRAYVDRVVHLEHVYNKAWHSELYPGILMFDPILEVTENANTYTPLAPGDERIVEERYVLWIGRGDEPGWNVAQRFRFAAGEEEDVRAEVHAHLRARGRTVCTWEVGSSATPPDLVERLVALGLTELVGDYAVGMALTEPPSGEPPDGVEVRRSASDADELVAAEIAAAAFGGTAVPRAFDPDSDVVTYLAYLDGRPVGRATGSFTMYGVSFFGGTVLPEARGRGCYRALVQARWADAVARGTPVAFTQGGPMSRPILARLGFRQTCEIRSVLDRFAERTG